MTIKGKQATLGAKILASTIAVLALVAKVTLYPNLDIMDAIQVALFVTLVFVPVDLSLLLEKIFRRKPEDASPGSES